MKEIYVFGHKKPDTDAVTSAIALANLKNSLGMKAKPMILGHINKETQFVLNYFNVEIPEYLEDVKLQIKDLKYYKNCFIYDTSSLKETYDYMNDKKITGVPVVDGEQKFIGLVTSKMLCKELIEENREINTSYDNIIKVLDGKKILKYDSEICGYLYNNVSSADKNQIIIADNIKSIKDCLNNNLTLIILTDDKEIKNYLDEVISYKINLIKSKYDIYETFKKLGLSNYVKNIVSTERTISFNENDYYDDFKDKCLKLGYNNYPVVDSCKKCLGLVRITDIDGVNKKQVILVDHNSSNQSVEGLEEAEILEIIDHHNIGTITTSMPINFRNMTVGSTNTILYSMYNEKKVAIPKHIAGLMLSGIISDTLKFTSPTTTEYDKYVAMKLASIASIDIDDYSSKMFKAGTNLQGKTMEQIIEEDMKVFEMGNKKFAISQVLTLTGEDILEKKKDYIAKIDELKSKGYFNLFILCVTDLIKDGSYIFYDSSNESLIKDAIGTDNVYEGYFIPKCLSRKKQLLPLIMNVFR